MFVCLSISVLISCLFFNPIYGIFHQIYLSVFPYIFFMGVLSVTVFCLFVFNV